ncbi:hypothetical protein B0H13DRAFT_2109603 [Mycena leptocephala]|nr:hypothetical protein B0H13DRAFT_2109603 [Mycena leptocephala]
MSVQELRARIDKLSTEIELHRQLLKKLESEKSLVQRQLNTVLDPIGALPFELSSRIFLQTLAGPSLPEPGTRHGPMLLVNICNAWTDVALSTPALWAGIRIVFPCARRIAKVLPIWFLRAHSHPLSVSLRGKLDRDVIAVIWRHGQQLKDLDIYQPEDDEDSLEEGFIDLVGGASPRALPLLETLTIRGLGSGRAFSAPQILGLLRLAPNLAECIFGDMQPLYGVNISAEALVLPALRRLTSTRSEVIGGDDILTGIAVPALETLELTLRDVDDLFSFLKRSSPPLRDLVLSEGKEHHFVRLADCLRLVPTLSHLGLAAVAWPPSHASRLMGALFAALGNSESPPLLPNLHSLVLFSPAMQDFPLQALHRAVSARRTQLRVVQVKLRVLPDSASLMQQPMADIFTAFRELAADGMQIYIGGEGRSIISN